MSFGVIADTGSPRDRGASPRSGLGIERDMDAALGQRIKALRRLRRMTQSDLARVIGVTYQQIYKYEYGTDRIAISRLVQIAAALSVSILDLVDSLPGTTPAESLPQSNVAVAERVRLLDAYCGIADEDVRRQVCDLVSALSGTPMLPRRRAP